MATNWDIAGPDTPAAAVKSPVANWDVASPDTPAPLGSTVPTIEGENAWRAGHPYVAPVEEGLGTKLKHGVGTLLDVASDALVAPAARGIAGMAASFGGNPEIARETADESFASHSPQAEELLTQIGQAVPLLHAFGAAGEAGHTALNKTLGEERGNTVANTVGDIAGVAAPVLGAAHIAGAPELAPVDTALAEGHRVATEAKAADAIDNRLRTAGFRTSPSTNKQMTGAAETPSHFATGAESLDPAGVQADNIAHNRPVINGWGATDIGLPRGSILTEEEIDSKEAKPAATYAKIKERLTERSVVSPETHQALADAGQDSLAVGQELPAEVARRASIFKDQPMNADDLMTTISKLRRDGFKNKLSKDTNANALGRAQIDQASALEAELNRRVSTQAPELNGEYQAARKQFAKLNTVRAALHGYDIDPQAVAKLADKNEGIDGGLKIITDAAKHAPNDVKLKVPTAASTTRIRGGSPLGIPVIGHGAAAIARKVIGATRGETPAGGLNAAAGSALQGRYFPTSAAPSTPPLNLTPPPGSALTPHQPGLPLEPGPPAGPPLASRLAGNLELAPNSSISRATAPPGGFSLADLLSGDLQTGTHGGPPGLSLAPNAVPAAAGLPFRAPAEHMAGGLELAPEGAAPAPAGLPQAGGPPPRGPAAPHNIADVMSSRVEPTATHVTHAEDDVGGHTFTVKGKGKILAQETDTPSGPAIQIKRIDSNTPGTGAMLSQTAADTALAAGKHLVSDVSVSPRAASLYAKLKKLGYTLKENPHHINPTTKNLVSNDPRVPIFEITAAPSLGAALGM